MKVNKNLQPVSIPIEPHNQYIKMTPKEGLHKMTRFVVVSNVDERIQELLTEDSKYPIMQTEEYKVIEHALTELEELKRDVKRFMEIANDCVVIDGCIREYIDLRRKLTKVGNEDV